jgi:SAM-dependent methyltransferase
MSQAVNKTETYFDSDYYQAGHKKGTRYADYLQNAMGSVIYSGMSTAIMEVFKPRRVLEIGCAAGPIVRRLNEMGCEAHGIDVSEWAVLNRFHPNVIRASADELPYETASFDLVFSCHTLEHLPDAIADGALAEIRRVAGKHQFHMMPIIGIPPYDGPLEATLANLRSDPTHNLLRDRGWWLENLERQDWRLVPANILLDADNSYFEFSSCQILLSKNGLDVDLLRAVQDFNLTFFKRVSTWELRGNLHHGARSQPVKATHLGAKLCGSYLTFRDGVWADLVYPLPTPADLRDAALSLYCHLRADAPVKLRLSALTMKDGARSFSFSKTDIAGVAQIEIELRPGFSVVELPLNDFQILYGAPRPDRVGGFMLGGQSFVRADLECVCVLKELDGVCTSARQLSPVGQVRRHASRFRDVVRSDGLAVALTKAVEKIGKRLARDGRHPDNSSPHAPVASKLESLHSSDASTTSRCR